MKSLYLFLAQVILATVLFRPITRSVGRLLGWYLRHKSKVRRQLILSRVEVDEEIQRKKKPGKNEAEDDDWGKMEGHPTEAAGKSHNPHRKWKGIVGFFHPFWLALPAS